MNPKREEKLLEAILRMRDRPPKWRKARAAFIGTAVWALAGLTVLTIIGGPNALTWRAVAVATVGFALGFFSLWDMRRQVIAEIWPLYARYLDTDAMERRLNELRTPAT